MGVSERDHEVLAVMFDIDGTLITTGGAGRVGSWCAASTMLNPFIVGKYSFPSRPRQPAGWNAPLHSLLFMPSEMP